MHAHVVPVNDLIEHDTEHQEDCICGPIVRLVDTPLGDGWVYTHRSLDRREQSEEAT